MLSLAEYFHAFHTYAVENELSASSRVLYYTILGMFNERYWKVDKVSISVRDMQVHGGFHDKSAVERGKTVLGTENIVKIDKLKNRKTQYSLVDPQFWLRNQKRNTDSMSEKHLRDGSGASGLVSYTVRAEDLKTLKPKDKQSAEEEREREEGVKTENSTPNIKVGQKQNIGGKEKDSAEFQSVTPKNSPKFAGEMSSEKNIEFEQREDVKASSGVVKVWREATYTNPTDLDLKGLAELEKEYGTLNLRQAIIEGNRYKKQDQVNLALVEAILKNEKKKKDEKRDDRRGVSGFNKSTEKENGRTEKEGRGGEIEPWDFAGHDNTDYSDARKWVEEIFEKQKKSGKFK